MTQYYVDTFRKYLIFLIFTLLVSGIAAYFHWIDVVVKYIRPINKNYDTGDINFGVYVFSGVLFLIFPLLGFHLGSQLLKQVKQKTRIVEAGAQGKFSVTDNIMSNSKFMKYSGLKKIYENRKYRKQVPPDKKYKYQDVPATSRRLVALTMLAVLIALDFYLQFSALRGYYIRNKDIMVIFQWSCGYAISALGIGIISGLIAFQKIDKKVPLDMLYKR